MLTDAAFDGTRRPLVADFTFNGEVVRLINVHFTSRGGSDPLFGANQPPANEGDAARIAQGTAVANYVNDALATDPSLRLGVLGDFNGFYFEDGLQVIEAGGVMTNLYNLLAPEERYSYMFDGNLQALDAVAALHRRSRQFRPPRRERDGDRPLYLYDHRCCRPQQHGQRQRDRHGGARRRPRRCRPW